MVGYAAARDELYRRLCAVFASGAFADLYGVERPKVYRGFPTTEPPFYVAVDEIATDARATGSASMWHAEFTFGIKVYLFAQHVDLIVASDTMLAYLDAAMAAVLADATLAGTVDNATASVDTEGTAADSSRRYMAAAQMTVECRVYSACPAELLEAINETQG